MNMLAPFSKEIRPARKRLLMCKHQQMKLSFRSKEQAVYAVWTFAGYRKPRGRAHDVKSHIASVRARST